jgi:hypothetical protein
MCRNLSKYAAGVMALALLSWTMAASAQLPVPLNSQFAITGVLQSATLGLPLPYVDTQLPAFRGGTLTVNGQLVIVPANTVVQYPGNNSTWAEAFSQAPAPWNATTPPTTGMARTDTATIAGPQTVGPLTTWEVSVVGNRMGDTYIAGLVSFSQQALNSGAGFINFINYATGDIYVGGQIGNSASGTRVRINEAPLTGNNISNFTSKTSAGRYSAAGAGGIAPSPDLRFTADQDNPTIRSVSGYPMGLSSVDPLSNGGVGDPLRPESNRPKDATTGIFVSSYVMDNGNAQLVHSANMNQNLEAPFEVGDYINYAGTLVKDGPNPTAGPWPAANLLATTYIAAHTIIDNVAIYTMPGSIPSYCSVDTSVLGVGGVQLVDIIEAARRTVFQGFSTDVGANIIQLESVDLDPKSASNITHRDWGTVAIDLGPPNGASKGRYIYRPPGKVLTMPALNTGFGTPTREVEALIAKPSNNVGGTAQPVNSGLKTSGNGLVWGQYKAPISSYLFPEQVPGSAIPPNIFELFYFLGQGGQVTKTSQLIVGQQLYPWPGEFPPSVANGPSVNAGKNQSVVSGTVVTLTGSASAPNKDPFTSSISQISGPAAVNFVLGSVVNGLPTATFKAPVVTAPPAGQPDALMVFQAVVTDTKTNVSSVAVVTVQVTPNAIVPSLVTITTVDQRASQQRLTITATSSPNNGGDTLSVELTGMLDANKKLILDPVTKQALHVFAPMTFFGGVYTTSVVESAWNATTILVHCSNVITAPVPTLTNTSGVTQGVWKIR